MLQLTVDGLLGTGEVNRLDTAGLLELGGNSRLGSSSSTRTQSRHESALLGGAGYQLPGSLAEGTSSWS